jgi:transposase InsO family protein|tara:strand:+ start:410 stop:1264 length:855 start_codon:yes stop_codon:yes gene_type:complete
MKKEEIRREFFKLRIKGHSYAQCRGILRGKYSFEATIRTLKRWVKRLDKGGWDLRDLSTKPHRVCCKATPDLKGQVLDLRNKTGWGERKIAACIPLSHTTINSILNEAHLCRETKSKGKRVKWVRWQRKHPNSLWQVDHTDEMDKGDYYTLSVVDDCSRYSVGLVKLNRTTTTVVTHILDQLIVAHGTPREILTDNGSAFGQKSKHSRFDRWCKRRGIKHIRTKVHSPQTQGKVERLFKTMDEEIEFCNGDSEQFRMRYNHFRPHSSLGNKTPSEAYFGFHNLF